MASSAMEQDTLSSYYSIIPNEGPYQRPYWNQLCSDQLAQLHGKFWGVNMQDEETMWRKTQPEEEPMSVDLDNQTPEEHEKEEDDIGPGSYILTLDIPGMEVSQLWIRQEYIRAYDFCEKQLDACRQATPSVVLTGQPGIGKSYWVYYAMRRYLAEKKPVIWYRDSKLFLFVKEGVFQAPDGFRHTTLKTRVRTLIDNDRVATTDVPAHLVARGSKYFIIFSTYPDPARWENLNKTTQYTVCIMNPWTKKEISKSAVIHGLAENDERMYEIYDRLGPTPRICFDYINNPYSLFHHRANRSKALGSLSSVTLHQMVDNSKSLTMDSISHTLILVKRMSKELRITDSMDDNALMALFEPRVELVSPVVEREIRVRLWEKLPTEQLQLYRQLGNVESTRCIASLAFEAWAHSRLRRRISLELVPMVKTESRESGQENNLPQWHTNRDGGNPLFVDITPSKTAVYEGSSLGRIEDGWYYLPESKTQVAFDSFIMVRGNLYIFQCSLASVNQIKGGILPFFSQESLPPRTNWHFVFVVPNDGVEITYPQPRDPGLKKLLGEMKLFTAAMGI